MTLRTLATFVFAVNVLTTVTGSASRAAPAFFELTTDDLAARTKTSSTSQTKRLENQADKDKDPTNSSQRFKSAPKDERGDRKIQRESK